MIAVGKGLMKKNDAFVDSHNRFVLRVAAPFKLLPTKHPSPIINYSMQSMSEIGTSFDFGHSTYVPFPDVSENGKAPKEVPTVQNPNSLKIQC